MNGEGVSLQAAVRRDSAAEEAALEQRRAAALERARQQILERALAPEPVVDAPEPVVRTYFVPAVTDVATGRALPSQASEVEQVKSFG